MHYCFNIVILMLHYSVKSTTWGMLLRTFRNAYRWELHDELSWPGLTGAARSTLGQDHRYLIKHHSLQVVPAMEAQKWTVSLGSLGFKKASK